MADQSARLRQLQLSFGHGPTEQWVKEGDRSHENLQILDNLSLSYPGWESDVREAENCHTGSSTFVKFEQKIWEIEEKQRMYEGDRSHPRLKQLDALRLSYDGWKDDMLIAEEQHVHARIHNFRRKVEGMKRSQSMHDGDRSHRDLVTLDRLKHHLSYPGWQEDWQEAELSHRCLTFSNFDDKLEEMRLKQKLHDGDRSHPRLQALDALHLTYPGYQDDLAMALEQHLCDRKFNFQVKLDGMKQKQKIFQGDRSHPNLKLLESLKLTYPDHDKDVKEAIDAHTGSIWAKVSLFNY